MMVLLLILTLIPRLGMPGWVYEFNLDKSLVPLIIILYPDLMAKPIKYKEAQPINADRRSDKQLVQLLVMLPPI